MAVTETACRLLPKQYEFVNAAESEVLYSGAFRAGKTRALCYKVLQHALIPANFVGLCRKTLVSLRQTTLRTLLESESNLPPVLPPGCYHHRQSERLIHIIGGGTIYYFGCDNHESLGGLNCGAIGVDEAIELDEHEYMMLLGRISNKTDPVRQLFSATNPGPKGHVLHRRFVEQPDTNRRYIHTRSYDNVFLPPDYLELLGTFTGQARARYVEGEWGSFEGLVYDTWDRGVHVRERPPDDMARWYVGIDAGYSNAAVCLLIGRDGEGRWHVAQEWYRQRALPNDHADLAAEWCRRYGCQAIVDPSAAGMIAELRHRGVSAVPAEHHVSSGIASVRAALAAGIDGRPRLTFSPACEHTLIELQSYRYELGTDRPVKELDHALDALRYVIYTASLRGPIEVRLAGERRNDRMEPHVRADNRAVWSRG